MENLQKFLPKILIWTFIFWILYVMVNYFQLHPEYFKAFSNSTWLFSGFFMVFWTIFWGIYLYQKFYLDKKVEFKRSPLIHFLIWILWVWLIWTLEFSTMQKSLWLTWYFSSIWAMFWHLIPVLITLITVFVLSFVLWDRISNLLKITWAKEKYWIINIIFWLSVILLWLFFLWLFWVLNKVWVLWFWIFILIFSFSSLKNFWNWFIWKNLEKQEFKFLSLETFLYFALFFLISVNIFDVIRPMPIWWDDMGVYLNMPKRIAEDAAILAGQWGQAWMLMTSLWFILRDWYVGTTVSMFLNFFWWLLWVMAVFAFINRFFKNRIMALFWATFYYFMPMITFQSALDMKMDPTLFLFMVWAALILFDKWNSILDKIRDLTHKISLEDKIKWWVWWFILWTAFFIKITTAMQIFAFLWALSFFIFNWKTALWVIFLETSIFLLWFVQIPEFSPEFTKILAIIFWIIWIILIAISKIKKYQAKHFFTIWTSVWIWFLFVAIPWAIFNYSSSHTLSMWWLTSWKFTESPIIDYIKVGIDEKWADKEFCTSTWWKEEQWRYIWADQPFFQKYFTLPWKNTMNTQVHWYYLDIWFLFLALLPGLFLLWIWRRFWKLEWWLMILFSINWLFWAFAAKWIPWYWLFWFLPAIVLLSMVIFDKNYWVEAEKKGEINFFKYIFIWLIIISICAFWYLRETKTFSQATVAYAFWKINWDKYIDWIVPTYRDTVKLIDSYPHNAENPNYLYRVWTFIPFFIKDVRRVMVWDSQLDRFRCIDWDWKDDARTLKRLKDLWFKFFVLDTNTYTIEKNPNWTLHKKYKRFIEFANKNLKVLYYKPKNWIAFMMIK